MLFSSSSGGPPPLSSDFRKNHPHPAGGLSSEFGFVVSFPRPPFEKTIGQTCKLMRSGSKTPVPSGPPLEERKDKPVVKSNCPIPGGVFFTVPRNIPAKNSQCAEAVLPL